MIPQVLAIALSIIGATRALAIPPTLPILATTPLANLTAIVSSTPQDKTPSLISALDSWPKPPFRILDLYSFVEIQTLHEPPNTSPTYKAGLIQDLMTLRETGFEYKGVKVSALVTKPLELVCGDVTLKMYPLSPKCRLLHLKNSLWAATLQIAKYGAAGMMGLCYESTTIGMKTGGDQMAVFEILLGNG